MTVHRRELLDIATEVLAAQPTASLSDVASAAGIGRTTLHKRYARREDLLLAVGYDAVRKLAAGIAGADLPTSGDEREPAVAALRRLVAALVPLGAQVDFHLRQPALHEDAELAVEVAALDEPIAAFVRHAQAVGLVRAGLAPWWVVSMLFAVTYSAWEGVHAGRLAPLDAPALAYDTFVGAVGA
jgi:AcrR family transcriptional regulator